MEHHHHHHHHHNTKKRGLSSPSANAYLGISVSTPTSKTTSTTTTTTTHTQDVPWSLPKDAGISPTSKLFTKKAALKRSAGLLNLSIGKESDVVDNDFTANGVTKSFNDLNFENTENNNNNNGEEQIKEVIMDTPVESNDDEIFSPYINRLKRPLASSASTPISSSSPFVIPPPSQHQQKTTKSSLSNKLRNALSNDNVMKPHSQSPFNHHSYKLENDNKENMSFVAPTKRGSTDGNKSPNDSPSKPLRQKPRYNSSAVASHIFKSNNRNTSTPIENNKNSNFVTPSSYKSVKPLQTAFMSAGLLSKKTAKVLPQTKAMPETPCKRPSQHMLVDTNGSFSSNLATSVINATDDDLMMTQNTPTSSGKHSTSSHTRNNSGKYSSGKNSTRSERAVNTTDLQSCLLRFTNEFDDFYEDSENIDQDVSPSISSSIFRESAKNSEMEIDYDYSNEFPATPTKLGNKLNDDTPSRNLQNSKKTIMSSFFSSSSAKPKLSTLDFENVNSPIKQQQQQQVAATPRTPVEPAFGNSTTMDSYNTSILSSSNNNTLATDVSFSFLQPYSHKSRSRFDDEHLTSKFKNVQLIGSGEFSLVYSMEFQDVRYAVKRTKQPLTGPKTRLRKLEEVEILKRLQENEINDYEGHEYVLNFIDCWEFNSNLYIMTEFCENGSLDKFLIENGKIAKLDEWRVWKILTEILIGLRFLHNNDILHLDLKPANIFITFEGSLKIGDFGLATKLPIPPFFEREGDREYIAPEVISHQQYDKPADIFSVGLIMVEIAANIILPDNGASWQKLRSGDLTDAGKLSSTDLASYTSSMFNNGTNNNNNMSLVSNPSSYSSNSEPVEIFKQINNQPTHVTTTATATNLLGRIKEIPSWAPVFLTDGKGSLDSLVHWMINPNPNLRPSADIILNTFECQFVESRRKCGSVIYEGEFGPSPDNADLSNELEMAKHPRILELSKSRASSLSSLRTGLKLTDSNDTLTRNTIDNMLS